MGRERTAGGSTGRRGFLGTWSSTLIFSGLMMAATGNFLLAVPFISGDETNWLALGCLITGLFTANMARMLQIWGNLKPAIATRPSRRTSVQRATAERGFRGLFLYVFLSFGSLTAVTFASAEPGFLVWDNLGLHGTTTKDANVIHVCLLVACLGASLMPLLSGFYLQARAEERAFARIVWRHDAISVPSFWASAVILGSIVGLANWATKVSGRESETLAENLTFLITLAVIALFVAFIFLPHLVRYLERAGEDANAERPKTNGVNPLTLPAFAFSYLDSFLVRLIAPLTGATQKGDGVPHSFVILSLVPMTALGFVLAPPYGLIPIVLGMVMVIALGRRWAWIEEDRETASRLLKTESPEIQVGFDNDLKDEALLGYASLFLLVPLALHQIYGWQPTAFDYEPSAHNANVLVAWLSFFGAELAKAVPFVDWWEIYQVDLSPPIEASADNPLGKHLTFAARAMVDLVIMAALFQAVAIWQRSRAQKRLYQIGHVNHFEPFAEREFFEGAFRGNLKEPRAEFVEKVQKHIDAREALRLPGEPYNPERLADLLKSESPNVQLAALWMVQKYQILTGPPQEQIRQLVGHWLNISFPQLSGSQRTADRKRLLKEKHKFEQLLEELADDTSVVRKSETGLLLGLLEAIRQVPEFSFAQIEAIRLFGKLRNEYALLALAAHVAPPNETEWRQRIQLKFGLAPNLYLGQAPMRLKVYEALEMFGLNLAVSLSIRTKTLRFLETMSVSDPAIPCRERAHLAAQRIREDMKIPHLITSAEETEEDEDPDAEE